MKCQMYLRLLLTIVGWVGTFGLFAQHVLYPSAFDLQEVTLLESPFKTAQELNFKTLMEYNTDCLLTPYVRQSGLSATNDEKSPYYQWEYEHPAFTSFAWNPALAMDGHVLGHYLSALSYAYAACHDEMQRAGFKQRIDYIVKVLCDCQAVFDRDKSGMKGFIGGLPDNSIWTSMLDADYRVYNQRGNWVPYYCEHKVMAGLRDAYVYAGNEQAKEAFRKMCDWVIQTVSMFNADLMELHILQWETGGMHEVLADASELFDENKYMKAAVKFSHQIVIENMNSDPQHEFLDKRHTNELAAMFLGFTRVGFMHRDPRYRLSAQNFWNEVTNNRIMAIGGTGVGGYFVPKKKSASLLNDADGPDLCTSFNLMKLSYALFSSHHDARYPDYAEKVLLNHILSSIDPETGGFTYYTSMRPESYRIYSKVNEAMWCCMGSGMESQSTYGKYIYTYDEDTLYVNQFVPSELNSTKIQLIQESKYPYGDVSKITIRKSGNYQLAVRHPSWAATGFSVSVNGKPVRYKPEMAAPGCSSFIFCGKGWKAGDVIEVHYPMTLTFVQCPGNPDYIALRYGPNVLAAQTTGHKGEPGYEPLLKEYGGDGLHDFSPQARLRLPNIAFAPMLICEMQEVPNRVKLVNPDQLEFEVDASALGSQWKTVRMRPFFDLHHCRYSIYWNRQVESAWKRNPMYQEQVRKQSVGALTLDELTPGDAASEEAHELNLSETGSRGILNGRPFRDAQPDQWFEYSFDAKRCDSIIKSGQECCLVCRLAYNDRGRSCDLSIDGESLLHYELQDLREAPTKEKFFEQVFLIPSDLVQGKEKAVLRVASSNGSYAPRFYQMRLSRYDAELLR